MGAIESPIIILGAARSGTTLLADVILAKHPALVYVSEPVFLWRYGHAYRPHDVLRARDATPAIRETIQSRFRRYLDGRPSCRLMEKTPSNCFRMPFILEVFPEAQVVHVLRDGRDVALSAAREWAGRGRPRMPQGERPPGDAARVGGILKAHAQLRERVFDLRSLLEVPAYARRALGVVWRQAFHSSRYPWGPRFPGLRQIRRTFSLLETCALQWELSVLAARSACLGLPRHQYVELRYEDLVQRPREEIERVLATLDLSREPAIVDAMTSEVDLTTKPKWRRHERGEIAQVEGLVGATLSDLGYPLARQDDTGASQRPDMSKPAADRRPT
jgi:hypothetical protein